MKAVKDTSGFYIYIISNPAFPGWYKVGRSNDPFKRLNSYQTSDPNRGYKLEFHLKVKDPKRHETHLYSLESCSGEWIKCELNSLIQVLNIIEGKLGKIEYSQKI